METDIQWACEQSKIKFLEFWQAVLNVAFVFIFYYDSGVNLIRNVLKTAYLHQQLTMDDLITEEVKNLTRFALHCIQFV